MRLTRKSTRKPTLRELSGRATSFLRRDSRSIKLTNEKKPHRPVRRMIIERSISREYSRHIIEVEEEIEAGAMEHLVIQTCV